MKIASIGIDIGKMTFHLIALDQDGGIVVRKKFSRKALLAYTANLTTSLIGIEACAGAHFLGRALREQGHEVRLMPAQFVKPYVKSNKNDYRDAEAIAEAVTRKNMRFVPIKTDSVSLRKEMPALLEDTNQNLTPSMRALLDHLWQEWKYLDHQVDIISGGIDLVAENDEACQRLRGIPGIGPLVSTATVAAVGNGAAFKRGRDFAAWLGLIPKQHSTGDKPKLLRITKRGNTYLRTMFVHGARAVLLRVKYDTGGFGQWVHRLEARAPRNKVIIAIANKLARIAWAVLSTGKQYQHPAACAQA